MRTANRTGGLAWLGLFAVLLLDSGSSSAASLQADSFAGGRFVVFTSGTTELDTTDNDVKNPASSDDSVTAFAVTEFNFASALGSAGFGWLRASANATSQVGGNSLRETSSNSVAQWQDVITLTPADPALLNTAGLFAATITTGGGLLAQTGFPGSAIASVGVNASFGSGITAQEFRRFSTSTSVAGVTTNTGDISLLLDFDVAFIWGQPLSFSANLVAIANSFGSEGNIGSGGEASSNFANTSEWGGITNVRRSDGGVVTDFQLTSGSGANYLAATVAPVPLPASVWLLGTAVAGLVGRRWLQRTVSRLLIVSPYPPPDFQQN